MPVSDEPTTRLSFSFGLAVAQLAIALYVSSRGNRRFVNISFGALGCCLAAWTTAIGIAHTPFSSAIFVRSAFAAASLLVLALLTFVLVFPSASRPWRYWWYQLFFAFGLLFTVLAFTRAVVSNATYVDARLLVAYGPLHRAYGIYVGSSLLATVFILIAKLRRSKGREYLQLRYLLIALLLPAGAIAVTNLLIPLLFGSSHLGRFGPAFSLVFLAVTAHAMIRQRLMDIKLVVGQTVSYGVAVAATGLIFTAGMLWATAYVPQVTGGSRLTAVAVIFGAALLFTPFTRKVRKILDRYCYREPYDYNALVRRSSALLSSTVDPQQLLKHLFALIRDSVRPEFMAAYLYKAEAAAFGLEAYEGETDDFDLPGSLDAQAPLVRRLAGGDRAIVLDAEEQSEGHLPAIAWLRQFDAQCAFAIVHEDEVLALVILGHKLSGDPYFAHDLDLLATITSQAAVAIKNAALYRHLTLLETQRRRAERVAESGALSAGIAHEIKNPLVAIRTFAELLPERYEDEEFRTEFSRVVQSEIGRIDRLIDRLRGLAGTSSDENQPIDVRKPLDETISLLSKQFEQGSVQVIRNYDDDVPIVDGNADKLKQLFLNLLLNAAESMAGAGGVIAVHVHSIPQLGVEGVSVEIEDEGHGIADSVIDTLFHPFVTTKGGNSRGNSGLGLWVCRRIADEHNAVLRASNRKGGKGARFTLDIPVSRT
jgi:two-component system, NtrC family, sensor histidine kinase HydH